MHSHRDTNRILDELLRNLKTNSLVGEPEGSNDFTEVPFDDEQILRQHNTAHVTPPPLPYTSTPTVLATMEPLDTFLMGDEVISTILERENDEFIKSSVDDLVLIPRESELTLDSTDLECSMPIDPPLPCTDVSGDTVVDIDLLLGEHLDTLSMGDREIDFNPSRDIEELERLLADDSVLVPRVFDEPLSNSDLMPISSENNDLFWELIAEFGLDDSIPTEIDDRCHDSEGDILYFEQLLNEDTSSDVSPALLPTESSSLDLPLPNPKHIFLKEVERFDPFFSLTQSGRKTRVMETPSFGFHNMTSPRPATYSPKEVRYCYYHPRLTSGDVFDHGPKMK
ncbi:hypothetical protein Tco_0555383 [Tanacetum coccineum]